MRRLALSVILVCLFVSVSSAQPPDTLIDVRQWPADDGGNDHYYGIIPIVQPWVDHAALAPTLSYAGHQGYLATIGSAAEDAFIEALMADHTDQPSNADEFYLGGSVVNGLPVWGTGEPVTYTDWEPGEPSGDGPALAIWGMSNGAMAGKWNDVPEDTAGYGNIHQLWALVEFGPVDTTTPSPDTLIDVRRWTVAEGGNDHYYGVIPLDQSWSEHMATAAAYVDPAVGGGYLVTIRSDQEQAFVESLIADHPSQPDGDMKFFLGGAQDSYSWQWGTGELFSYHNWGAGQPQGPDENLVMYGMNIGPSAGFWTSEIGDTGGTGDEPGFWAVWEAGTPDPVDTLLNLRQWSSADGGNDNWYAVVALERYWNEADSFVGTLIHEGYTGYLATVRSAEENQFLTDSIIGDLTQGSIENSFWLGGVVNDGVFEWQTGEQLLYSNWADADPYDRPDETVIAMWGPSVNVQPGTWLTAYPDNSISDLQKWWALVEFGPVDTIVDTVFDVRQWTVAEGGNDHYYGIMVLNQRIDEHRATADVYVDPVAGSGYLATIRSPEEQAFIQSLLADHTSQPGGEDVFFLGADFDYNLSRWSWPTGETFIYCNWLGGYPTEADSSLALYGMSWTLSKRGKWFAEKVDSVDIRRHWAVWEAGPTGPVDTLLNLKQWSGADGGNDHWYAILGLSQYWVDANTLAGTLSHAGEQGYLATITSPEENQFILDSIIGNIQQGNFLNLFWLGGIWDGSDFGWPTGELFDYTNWSTFEPNLLPMQSVMSIYGLQGVWTPGSWNSAPPADSIKGYNHWLGVIEFSTFGCCPGGTGNVDNDSQHNVNLTDLTVLVNHLFVGGPALPCPAAANTSGDAGCVVSLTDVTLLVNHLFVTFEPLAPCNPSCE